MAKSVLDILLGGPGSESWQFADDWSRGILRASGRMDEPYRQVGPFHRAVSVIARDSASVPWEFYPVSASGEPGDDPVEGHPVFELWRKPNGHMYGNQLMIGSYISKMVFGEWIWWYPGLRLGRADGMAATRGASGSIFLLDPRRVARKMDDTGTIQYALRDTTGRETPLNAEEVTHSRRHNPYDPVQGLSLAASIIADLVGYHAAASWNERFFNEQNGIPTLLLKPGREGQMAQAEDRETFLRRFLQKHGNQRRNIGLLPGGWDVADLGLSQRDMDFAELRQFGRDEVLANCGVPPLIAGYLTRPITYNASEQKQLYWESTIWNFLCEEQACLNEDFLPKIGVAERVYPHWDVVKALLENLVEKTQVATQWFAMGLSKKVINERLEMGWTPEDIDDYEVQYLPFSLAPIGTLDDMRSLAGPVADDDDEAEEDDQSGNGEDTDKTFAAHLRESRRTMVWRNLVAKTRDLETRFNSVVRSHIEAVRREVHSNLQGTRAWLASIRKKDDFGLLFDTEEAKRKLQTSSGPLHREALKRGGDSIFFDIGSPINFELHDPMVNAKLAEMQYKITRITDTMERELRDSLGEGLALGESPQQLAKRVEDVMMASKGRSMRIARTETGFAFGQGRHLGMQQAGIEKHEWLSARDARVRDDHRTVDGQVVRIGEPFRNGLLFPLDPSGPAGQVVNCRCTALPVLEGEQA